MVKLLQNLWHTTHSFLSCGIYKLAISLAGAATSIIFVTTKSFVMTNTCLSEQNTSFVMTKVCLSEQNFCRDKNDTCGSSRQRYCSIISSLLFYDDIPVCSIFITMVKVRPFRWRCCVCCCIVLLCIHYFTSPPWPQQNCPLWDN